LATFDSPSLLGTFNDITGRPQPADAIQDTRKYGWLTLANNELIANIAAICPWVLYPTGAFPTMSTVDSKIFTFGTDTNGYPITPIGKTGIYTDLTSIPDSPWREGWDYLNEGSQIRIPNDGTYTGTLYYRGIVQPADLNATSNPTLLPEASRVLIPHIASLNFARSFARNPALVAMELDYLGTPWGMKPGAFSQWCVAWRTQFRSGGALGVSASMVYTGGQGPPHPSQFSGAFSDYFA
jgi:hypothetical protein